MTLSPSVVLLLLLSGCAAVRYADYKAPGLRLDRPHNRPLPPDASQARATWEAMTPEERQQFPTPYHVYVDAPAPGTFEGDRRIGLAFSGGGTRGVVFGAACIKELVAVSGLLEEVDYVSGVSTGAVPAAVFALNYGPHCPERLRFEHWPECFNVDVIAHGLGTLARRPDWVLRDFALGMNTRATVSASLAELFFEGSRYAPDSGLTFAYLPRTPVTLLGSTVINDPASTLVQTRLAYRYALDHYPEVPWQPGIQSFESFHSDPMSYPLGEACHNSLAYPGSMSSGLMAVHPDPEWILDGLDAPELERMRRARTRGAYEGVCEVKDGGLTDNRGTYLISRLFETLPPGPRPLLIAVDASQFELRMPVTQRHGRMGWLGDLVASMTASWQTGQDTYRELVELQSEVRGFDIIEFRYTAWVQYLSQPGMPETAPETAQLRELCREEPLIDTPERLIEVAQGIGTSYTGLNEEELAAVCIAARFAVWLNREALQNWLTTTAS